MVKKKKKRNKKKKNIIKRKKIKNYIKRKNKSKFKSPKKKNKTKESLKSKFKIYVEKINIRIAISKLKKIEKLQIKEKQFLESKERKIQDRRDLLLKQIKQEERSKIVEQKDHLWKLGDRFKLIRDRYKAYKQKLRDQQLEELEIRRKSREEAKAILEQQKAENEVKKKVEERLERYSRNMKSIVFQINKRYLARKRSPLRFVDNIAENGECFIKNEDAPTDKDYLILLFINGDSAVERLSNPISIEDKTDMGNIKKFEPKDIFDASDFIIERLAIMFDNERKFQKSI